jgi:hypothetical protein
MTKFDGTKVPPRSSNKGNNVEKQLAILSQRADEQGRLIQEQGILLRELGNKLDDLKEQLVHVVRLEERVRSEQERAGRTQTDIDKLWAEYRSVDGRVKTLEQSQVGTNVYVVWFNNIFWKMIVPVSCIAVTYFLNH